MASAALPAVPRDAVARRAEWESLARFGLNPRKPATFGIVWGRRRIGKSFLLSSLCEATDGLYYEAIRGSRSEALAELGALVADRTGAPAPLQLDDWSAAVDALMQLGEKRPTLVVLDEYPYLREHSPELDSVLQRAFAPRSKLRTDTHCRLVVCGSALSVMKGLLAGTAPLHGRAGMDLRMTAFDFRGARELHDATDLRLALRMYAVVGGVAAYARDMVEYDLPTSLQGFDTWMARRVLSPAAPLFREVEVLLSEDPTTSTVRKPNLYHATMAGVALGNHAFSKLTRYVQMSAPSLSPILNGLIDAGFIARVEDPLRQRRPLYQPADSLLRFHYAVIRPRHSRFSRAGAQPLPVWQAARPAFASQVLGPCFEEMARTWVQHYADPETLGGSVPGMVGPSVLPGGNGQEVDVVAVDEGDGERRVLALGEAKAGERLGMQHLARLEEARAQLGSGAQEAKLLLFGTEIGDALGREARSRSDVEVVDLERLYEGS
jgi:uncharacterized protein